MAARFRPCIRTIMPGLGEYRLPLHWIGQGSPEILNLESKCDALLCFYGLNALITHC